jgi:hypothetical protein
MKEVERDDGSDLALSFDVSPLRSGRKLVISMSAPS